MLGRNDDTVGLVVVLLVCSKLSGVGDLLGLVVAGLVLYWWYCWVGGSNTCIDYNTSTTFYNLII